MKIVLLTMPACWEQDQHDFMNVRIPLFRWLRIKPLVNVVPSPSLLYLAPYMIEDGHDVQYIEGLFFTFENAMKRLLELKPDVIGVTLTSVDWENSRWMITEMKKHFPDATVVVGGIHPTLWQERCFEECDGIDYVVKGEGEHTMRELMNHLKKKEIPLEVPGLVFFHKGQLIKTPDRGTVENIDLLPMPSHQLAPPSEYLPSPTFYNRLPHANIIGARGCPYHCTFCHTDRHTRMRSAKNIVDEIEWLVKEQGVKDIAFWDDTFTLSEKRAFEFCDEILNRELDVDWAVNARVDRVSEKLLRRMKEAGCWRILYGIESGVQKNLDTLKKGTRVEQIRTAVNLTSKLGMEAYGTFMFGIPGETFEEGLQTIEFACSIDLDYAVFVNLTPLPGSEVYQDLIDGKIKPAKFTKDRFNFKNVSFVPEGFTEDQIRFLIQEGHRRFYLRPKLIWKKIRRMKSLLDLKKYINGFLLLATAKYMKKPVEPQLY
ncbi:MAG: B12-binding domain-containing radical SAM protein [Candidatus Sabulitectum sp.]|nr:B12-binding domain-containing radical SAM protein [Candidatus Sabulitectum sp.]